ncbi:MAG TPA: hypothetical protein VHQ47_03040 [Phycisphaerae bacterium]|nr:hypothetical protein [Phycisphaerae bacterium]
MPVRFGGFKRGAGRDALLAAAVAGTVAMAGAAWAQATTPGGTTATPGAAPAALPAPGAGGAAAAGAGGAGAALDETKPFVGVVTGDKVYVRAGPGNAYYEMGQLGKGDLVQVTGARLGWYQILPPNGTFCMIAKEYVDADATGQNGTLKADYVNVRAGTALYPNRDPSAVLTTLRKGAKLTILGSTDKYYEIAPPEGARVYISPQFVQAAPAGTEYKVPELKLPGGVSGPAKNTVTAPENLPATAIEISPGTGAGTGNGGQVAGGGGAATEPAGGTGATGGTGGTAMTGGGGTAVGGGTETGGGQARGPEVGNGVTAAATQPTNAAPPPPAVTFNGDAAKKYDELNTQYQAELQKPPAQRDLDPLIKSYQDLLNEKDLAPSVKLGSESRLSALQKLAAIERLAKENTQSQDALNQQRAALQQEYATAEKAIEDYEKTGPYLAEGTLQTSTAVQGKYALVNPSTGRVVAYVDPAADVDIGSLVGKYIGVRGTTDIAPGTQVSVIHVRNATLLPAPGGTDK